MIIIYTNLRYFSEFYLFLPPVFELTVNKIPVYEKTMRRCYHELCLIPTQVVSEDGFLAGSKVSEIQLEVEVDDYITIDEMTVTFD